MDDQVNKPFLPLAADRMSRGAAWALVVASCSLGLLITNFFFRYYQPLGAAAPPPSGRQQQQQHPGRQAWAKGSRGGPPCVCLTWWPPLASLVSCLPACLSKLIFFMYLAGIVAGGLYSIPPFYFKRFPAVAGKPATRLPACRPRADPPTHPPTRTGTTAGRSTSLLLGWSSLTDHVVVFLWLLQR